MRKLILVKHAKPLIEQNVLSHDWHLSEQGRQSCQSLARIVSRHDPAVVVTSHEPKAVETGTIIADALGKPLRSAPGLHEHDRSNVPMMDSRQFISTMALFFKERHRRVLGLETAQEALDRISGAIDNILHSEPQQNVAVVTHGTVLALFAAAHGAGDGFHLWRRLGLPSLIVFSLPALEVLEAVDRIG